MEHRFAGVIVVGRPVEGRHDVQTVFCKALIAQQGTAKLAGADDDGIGSVVIAQELLDVLHQGGAQIADLGAAAIGDQRQILAHLNFTHAQRAGQRGGGNVGGGILGHIFQISQVDRQPLQHRSGNFFSLYHIFPFTPSISIYFHIDSNIRNRKMQAYSSMRNRLTCPVLFGAAA